MDFDQTTLLYRVRKTVLKMLKDRGYLISEKKLNESKEEFAASFTGSRDSLNTMAKKRRPAGATEEAGADDGAIIVFFPDVDKLNVDTMSKISLMMLENNVMNSIVVIKGSTAVTKKVSKDLVRRGTNLFHFI